MSKRAAAPGSRTSGYSRRCKACKRERPAAAFLRLTRPRWRVTICNDCAQGNMRRWALYVEMDAATVERADRRRRR